MLSITMLAIVCLDFLFIVYAMLLLQCVITNTIMCIYVLLLLVIVHLG